MKKIFAFDVDGTLTLPREQFDIDHLSSKKFLETLYRLSMLGSRFAFISGSEEHQMRYQLAPLFSWCHEKYGNDLRFIVASSGGGRILDENNNHMHLDLSAGEHFRNTLGDIQYNRMISFIKRYVTEVSNIYHIEHYDSQITERGSMINISFPGRFVNPWIAANRHLGAGSSQKSLDDAAKSIIRDARIQFSYKDKSLRIREREIMILRESLRDFSDDLYVCMGGETGFDIAPMSATKLRLKYVLQHCCDGLFFVGDRCEKDQNDEPLYSALPALHRMQVKTMKKTEDLDRITEKLLEWSQL